MCCFSFVVMDKKDFINNLQMSVLVLDNVQYLDEWHEHVLTDFINYYGEPSNQIEEFNKILSNYNIDSNSKTTYNHKILLRKYRIKYHEF